MPFSSKNSASKNNNYNEVTNDPRQSLLHARHIKHPWNITVGVATKIRTIYVVNFNVPEITTAHVILVSYLTKNTSTQVLA